MLSVFNLNFNGSGPYDDIIVTADRVSAPPPVSIGLKLRAIETQVHVQVVYTIQP